MPLQVIHAILDALDVYGRYVLLDFLSGRYSALKYGTTLVCRTARFGRRMTARDDTTLWNFANYIYFQMDTFPRSSLNWVGLPYSSAGC